MHLTSTIERLEGVNRQLQQECDKLCQKMQQTAHENSILSRTNRDIAGNLGRLNQEGLQIKDFLDQRKKERNHFSSSRISQLLNQQLNPSRRPSINRNQ